MTLHNRDSVTAAEARNHLSEVIDCAAIRKNRVIVTRRGEVYVARLTGPQESNLLTSMARANGLAICPEETPELPAGAQVTVELLD